MYIKEKTTLWIFRSICHAENMNSSLSSNRELHKLSIIKLIKIWLGLTSCHGNIRVSHTCCFFSIITFNPNTLFLTFGCSMHVQLECLLSTFRHFEMNSWFVLSYSLSFFILWLQLLIQTLLFVDLTMLTQRARAGDVIGQLLITQERHHRAN